MDGQRAESHGSHGPAETIPAALAREIIDDKKRAQDDRKKQNISHRLRAKPGDHLLIWGFGDLCKNDNRLADGKYPDEAGRTPRGGAY
jgi:hypothetical protein